MANSIGKSARPSRRNWPVALTVIFFSAAPLWTAGVAAQDKDGQVFKDWRMQCQENAQAPNQRFCTIVHIVKDTNIDKTVAQINVGYPLGQLEPTAIATVPLAVRLPPGLGIQIDNSEVKSFPYELCTPNGCQAQIRLDATMVSNFKAGASGQLVIQVPPGKTATIPFSLNGFTSAFAALK